MGKKKVRIEDFNGAVVRLRYERVGAKDWEKTYHKEDNHIGITFVTARDAEAFYNSASSHVHIKLIDRDGNLEFRRMSASWLKRSRQAVPKALMQRVKWEISHYFKLGYFDNLNYIETIANLKKVKVTE